MKKIFVGIAFILFFGCNQHAEKKTMNNPVVTSSTSEKKADKNPFANSIEKAHNKEGWDKKKAVSFSIDLSFGGQPRMNAKITTLTNSSKMRIDKKDGSMLVYDGHNVYLCPSDANAKGARFDMFTWQYFFALPFKLNDPGTNWEIMQPQKIEGSIFNSGKLSFSKDTGDAPDDWYIIYQDPESSLLHAAAYIVTFGSNRGKAEKNPHAIVYKNYKVVDGIPIASTWEYHKWSEQEGIGDKIGEAKITDVIFFNAKDPLFKKPKNAKKIEMNTN